MPDPGVGCEFEAKPQTSHSVKESTTPLSPPRAPVNFWFDSLRSVSAVSRSRRAFFFMPGSCAAGVPLYDLGIQRRCAREMAWKDTLRDRNVAWPATGRLGRARMGSDRRRTRTLVVKPARRG